MHLVEQVCRHNPLVVYSHDERLLFCCINSFAPRVRPSVVGLAPKGVIPVQGRVTGMALRTLLFFVSFFFFFAFPLPPPKPLRGSARSVMILIPHTLFS